ncbi:MAG: penicillin-binding protein 2 [Deltaproteobacteria bacterium]|nr:penicillin-binding protein 2 [Deltaproteobacteria bacterium]
MTRRRFGQGPREAGEQIVSQEERITVYRWNYVWLWAVLLLVFLALCYRFYQLQITRGDSYNEKSEKNFIQIRRVHAVRGIIFDRKMRPLVENRASFNLHLTPAFSKNPRQTLKLIDRVIGLNYETFRRAEQAIKKAKGLARFQAIPLADDLDAERLALFEFHKTDLDGVEVVVEPHRHYKYGTTASHLLGYMGEIDAETLDNMKAQGRSYRQGDFVGKKGVESAYEEDLKGVDGSEPVLVDAKGRRVDEKDFKGILPDGPRKDARPGNNVVLSLDLDLQMAAEAAFEGNEGGVIAIDPGTGAVLAMVSRPAFDPNRLTGRVSRDEWWTLLMDPLKPLVNKVTQDHNHPGSTYKLVTALAALEEKAVRPETLNPCPGYYRLGKWPFRCWKEKGHGGMNLHRAIVQSCDVYFYRMGDKLGIERLADWAHILGFGEKTGIDIRDEVPGVVPNRAFYDRPHFGGYHKGYAVNSAIGQGDVNVTPLQLALAYAAVANGGRLMKPTTLLRVESPERNTLREPVPEVRRELPASPENLEAVKSGLVSVVNEPGGTAYSKRLPELSQIKIGGKTGTAQVVAIGAKRVRAEQMDFFRRDHAWFVAFAPAEDPEIAVAVINKHGGHGATGAAPIAMQVIKAYFEKVKGMKLEKPPRIVTRRPAPVEELEDTMPTPLPAVEEPAPAEPVTTQ